MGHFDSPLFAANISYGDGFGGQEMADIDPRPTAAAKEKSARPEETKGAHRRAPAVLDPVQLARQGEPALRARLAELRLEQLKDIVADYGMDPGKLDAGPNY